MFGFKIIKESEYLDLLMKISSLEGEIKGLEARVTHLKDDAKTMNDPEDVMLLTDLGERPLIIED